MAKDPPPSQIKHFKFVSAPKKKKKKKPSQGDKEGGEQAEEKAPTPQEEEDEEWKKERERREESLRRAQLWEEKRKAEKKGLKPAGRGRGRGRGGARRVPIGTGRRVRKVGASKLDGIPEGNETDDANRKGAWNDGNRPTTKQTLRPPTNQATRPVTTQSKRPITSQSNRPVTNQSKREPSRLSNRPPTVKSQRPETSKSLRPSTHQSQSPVTAAKEVKEQADKVAKVDDKDEEKNDAEETPVENATNEEPKEESDNGLNDVPKEEPVAANQGKEEQPKKDENAENPQQDEPADSQRKLSVFGRFKKLFKREQEKKEEEKEKTQEENEEKEENENDTKQEGEEEKEKEETKEESKDNGQEDGNKEKVEEPVAEEEKAADESPKVEEKPIKEEITEKETEEKVNEEPKSEEPKEEPQEEPKEEPHEEPKEEPQEKPQEEPKDEPKEEPKDEPQEEPEPEPEAVQIDEEEEKKKKGLFGLFRRKSKADDAISMKSISQSKLSLQGRSRINLQTADRAPSVVSKHSIACSPFIFDEPENKLAEDPQPAEVPVPKTEIKQEKSGLGWGKLKTTLFGPGSSTTLKPEVKEAVLAQDLTIPPEDLEKKQELTSDENTEPPKEEITTSPQEPPPGEKLTDVPEQDTKEDERKFHEDALPKDAEKKNNRPVIIINTTPQDASFQSTLLKALSGEGPPEETNAQAPQPSQQMPIQMPMGMPVMNPMMNPMMMNPMLNPMVNPYMAQFYPQQGYYPPIMPPGQFPPGYGYQIPQQLPQQLPQQQQPPQFFHSNTREMPAPSINDTVIVSKKKTKDKASSNELSGGALANFAQKYSAGEVQERVRRKIEEGEKEIKDKDLTDEWFEGSDSDDEFYKSEKRKIRRGRRRDMQYQQEKAEKKKNESDKKKEEAKIEEEKEKEREHFEKKMQGLLSLIETGVEVELAKTPEVKDEEIEEKLTQEREKILNESLKNDVPDMDLESFLKENEDKPKEDDEFTKMLADLNAEAAGNGNKSKDGKKGNEGENIDKATTDEGAGKNSEEKNKKVQEVKKAEGSEKKKGKLDDVLNNLLQSLNKPTVRSNETKGNGENDTEEKSEKEEMEKTMLPKRGETIDSDLFVKQDFTDKSVQNLKTSNSLHVSPISSREASGELQVGTPSKKEPSPLPSIQLGPGRKMTPEELLYNAQKQLFEAQKVLSPTNAPT